MANLALLVIEWVDEKGSKCFKKGDGVALVLFGREERRGSHDTANKAEPFPSIFNAFVVFMKS